MHLVKPMYLLSLQDLKRAKLGTGPASPKQSGGPTGKAREPSPVAGVLPPLLFVPGFTTQGGFLLA